MLYEYQQHSTLQVFNACSVEDLGSRQHDAERPQRNWIQGSSDLLVIPTDYIKTN